MLNIDLLIVEDDEQLLKSLYSSLEFLFTHIHIAKNGIEAIDIMQTKDIDVVVTDIHMPFASGIEVVRYAISHKTPIIPAVVVTGYDDFIKEWDGIEYIKVLQKPINAEILFENIKNVLKYSEQDLSEKHIQFACDACDDAQLILDEIKDRYK